MAQSRNPSIIRLLINYAWPFWKAILFLVGLALIANLLSILQPAIFAAVLASIIGGAPDPAPPAGAMFDLNALGGRVLEWLRPPGADTLTTLLILGGLYGVQAVAVATLNYGAFLKSNWIRESSCRLIQLDLLRHLLSLSLGFFHKQKSGELISRLTQDANSTAVGLGPLVRGVFHHSVQIVFYGVYLFSTSLWLSMASLGLLVLHFGLTEILKRPIRKLNRRMFDEKAGFTTTIQETLTGIRVAKSFGAEGYEQAKLKADIDRVVEANLKLGRIEKLEVPARAVLDSLAAIGVFLIALGELRAGALSVQGLLLYIYVGHLMIGPINYMASYFVLAQTLLASFERIDELFSIKPQVVDGPLVAEQFENKIEAKQVCFSYGHAPVLENVSLEIRRGEVVALVGPSGAGKSTLADLILRLYDPDSGEILLDGINLRKFRQMEYRRLFGVVSQESLLFHDTVRNNIAYGRREISEEDIQRAARIANAHDFIMSLPQGYDTLVGDRGIRLSGGQRQRVAIARAVVSNPAILILDEATSSLDSGSERLVQEAIDRVIESTTAIVIAHRLSTVLHADKIVVLDGGRIVDMGSHSELLERCKLYRRLCELQFGLENLAGPARRDGEGSSLREESQISGLKFQI